MVLEAPGAGGAEQKVTFPTSGIARIQLAGKVAEQDDSILAAYVQEDDVSYQRLRRELATQTAEATEDIEAKVREIQTATTSAESAIEAIEGLVEDADAGSGEVNAEGVLLTVTGPPVSRLRISASSTPVWPARDIATCHGLPARPSKPFSPDTRASRPRLHPPMRLFKASPLKPSRSATSSSVFMGTGR